MTSSVDNTVATAQIVKLGETFGLQKFAITHDGRTCTGGVLGAFSAGRGTKADMGPPKVHHPGVLVDARTQFLALAAVRPVAEGPVIIRDDSQNFLEPKPPGSTFGCGHQASTRPIDALAGRQAGIRRRQPWCL
jgi:hypothetical protein